MAMLWPAWLPFDMPRLVRGYLLGRGGIPVALGHELWEFGQLLA